MAFNDSGKGAQKGVLNLRIAALEKKRAALFEQLEKLNPTDIRTAISKVEQNERSNSKHRRRHNK